MLEKEEHRLISWWTSNFEGTLGSDCSRLGIKVSNSTGDVDSHGEIGLYAYFFYSSYTIFLCY